MQSVMMMEREIAYKHFLQPFPSLILELWHEAKPFLFRVEEEPE